MDLGVLGIVIGVLGVAVGIIATYRAADTSPKPSYKSRSYRVIGKFAAGSQLATTSDPRLRVLFDGIDVPSVSKRYVAIWNAGRTGLTSTAQIPEAPMTMRLGEGDRILGEPRVIASTQSNPAVINFQACVDESAPHTAECRFERLDRGQGVLVELLFTGDGETFKVDGVFDGAPRGIASRGILELKELIDFKSARRHLIREPSAIFFWVIGAPILLGFAVAWGSLTTLFTGDFSGSAGLFVLAIGCWGAAGLLGFATISFGAFLRTRDFRLILRPGHRVPRPLRAIRLSEVTHPQGRTSTSSVSG